MKKFFFFLLLIPVLGFSQVRNVVNATRVYVAPGKDAQFKKAIANHAKKFHKGDWAWRISTVETGPEAGAYHIVEGPASWEAFDGRGDLGAEHTEDWDKNIAPLLTERGSESYGEFNAEASTAVMNDYAEKVVLFHIYPKPGKYVAVMNLVKSLKSTWAAGNESVAVFESAASGSPNITIAYRLKAGLKELGDGFRKPMKERYETINGVNSYDVYLQGFAENVEKRWEELIVHQPNLDSK